MSPEFTSTAGAELRLQQLEASIRRELTLQNEYETSLSLTSDPRERQRCEREIERQRGAVAGYEQEYAQLRALSAAIAPQRLDAVGAKLQQMTSTLETLSSGTERALAEAQRTLAALPTEAIPPPAPLPPGSHMPLSPNPLFVGREDDLRALVTTLKGGETAAIGPLVAATGLGGIGKTQLAAEFVHRYGHYFAGGVFWLSFADPAAVPAEVAACGRVGAGGVRPFDLGEGSDALPLEQQAARVRAAWEGPLPRLLVFDNCEDEALLEAWRPPTGGSRVLVTSRRAEWDLALGVRPLPLGELNRQESVALLRRFRADLPPNDDDLAAIAEELGDLPLALHLAGSFLQRYRQAVSPAQYLAQLRGVHPLDHRSLAAAGLTVPTKHVQDVGRTFALSYDQLKPADATDRLAQQLLARAAHFAPGEPIPRGILVGTLGLDGADEALQFQAEDALRRLVELGLLEEEAAGALRLHRLLAAFVRARGDDAEAQGAVEAALLQEAHRLNAAGYAAPLLPLQRHLRAVTDAAMAREDAAAARLCNQLGYHLYLGADYGAARPLYERALAINERALGPDHPHTATSLNNLAALLRDQGELAAARPLHERALRVHQRRGHKDREGVAFYQLGLTAAQQGRLAEAALLVAVCYLIDRDIGHADTEGDFQALQGLAAHLGYGDRQLAELIEAADRAYREDRGWGLIAAALGEGEPGTT